MGFFARLLEPRGARRSARSGRSVKRAASPKAVKKTRWPLRPAGNAVYSVEHTITTALRSGRKKKTKTTKEWRHGKCPVKHRTPEAAARCRNP